MNEKQDERFEAEIRRQLQAAGIVKRRRWSRARSQGTWEDPRYLLDGRRMEEHQG